MIELLQEHPLIVGMFSSLQLLNMKGVHTIICWISVDIWAKDAFHPKKHKQP
jgi:hypothetical protein